MHQTKSLQGTRVKSKMGSDTRFIFNHIEIYGLWNRSYKNIIFYVAAYSYTVVLKIVRLYEQLFVHYIFQFSR